MDRDLGIVGNRGLISAHGRIRRSGTEEELRVRRRRIRQNSAVGWSVRIGQESADFERAMGADTSGMSAELRLSGDATDHRLVNRLIQKQNISHLQARDFGDFEVGGTQFDHGSHGEYARQGREWFGFLGQPGGGSVEARVNQSGGRFLGQHPAQGSRKVAEREGPIALDRGLGVPQQSRSAGPLNDLREQELGRCIGWPGLDERGEQLLQHHFEDSEFRPTQVAIGCGRGFRLTTSESTTDQFQGEGLREGHQRCGSFGTHVDRCASRRVAS